VSVVAASTIADRVTVVDSRDPGGRSAAANTGVEALQSEFVVVHDDDDLWHSAFLDQTVAWLDEHPADIGVGVATTIVYEERHGDNWVEVSRTPFWADQVALRFIDLLEMNRAVPISLLYRRAVHENVGPYDESLEAVEDWEFYLRVLSVGTLGFIGGAPLAMWTQRPGAAGPDGNSMFALKHLHERDDLVVRERALKAWVDDNGVGLPLYLAALENRIRSEVIREIAERFAAQERFIRAEINAHQPVWSRLRAIRARISGRSL
ncbi:MAG: glycosyltransferase family 2 protein, partial [Humibacter sp.]